MQKRTSVKRRVERQANMARQSPDGQSPIHLDLMQPAIVVIPHAQNHFVDVVATRWGKVLDYSCIGFFVLQRLSLDHIWEQAREGTFHYLPRRLGI